jgi:hypothetical protein
MLLDEGKGKSCLRRYSLAPLKNEVFGCIESETYDLRARDPFETARLIVRFQMTKSVKCLNAGGQHHGFVVSC